jgi:hypothetical protein
MKQVVRIDSAGFYVEPVILEDNVKEVPSDCVESAPPSLYKAKYVDGAWVEGASQAEIDALINAPQPVSELEQLKRNQELMQAALDELLLGGGL